MVRKPRRYVVLGGQLGLLSMLLAAGSITAAGYQWLYYGHSVGMALRDHFQTPRIAFGAAQRVVDLVYRLPGWSLLIVVGTVLIALAWTGQRAAERSER